MGGAYDTRRVDVTTTAVRAPGVDVLGAITLDGSMGGMNPVESAARLGARIVWAPTVDSRNERSSTVLDRPG